MFLGGVVLVTLVIVLLSVRWGSNPFGWFLWLIAGTWLFIGSYLIYGFFTFITLLEENPRPLFFDTGSITIIAAIVFSLIFMFPALWLAVRGYELHQGSSLYQMVVSYRRVAIIMLTQLIVGIIVAAFLAKVGTTFEFYAPTLGTYALIAVALSVYIWSRTISPDRLDTSKLNSLLSRMGIFFLCIIPTAIGWWVLLRVSADSPTFTFIVVALVWFVGWLIIRIVFLRNDATSPSWVLIGISVIIMPLLVGWVAGSLVWSTSLVFVNGSDNLTASGSLLEKDERCDYSNWILPSGEPIRIAVSLSGGGYRAAVVHAGLLAALSSQCIPITYLSTVSGGSIIGAYYALGLRPQDFARKLIRHRPGLPNDFLHILAVLRELFSPFYNSADTLTWHFEHVYFGGKKISDLRGTPPVAEPEGLFEQPGRPVLLINVTDIEIGSLPPREVLFNNEDLFWSCCAEDTLVAEAVAASAAFPGFFGAKRILWQASEAKQRTSHLREPAEQRNFVDGGVTENLGLEGLRRYLDYGFWNHRPHLAIIADATQHSSYKTFHKKASPWELLFRAQDIMWATVHQMLYSQWLGGHHREAGVYTMDYKALGYDPSLSNESPYMPFGTYTSDESPGNLLLIHIPMMNDFLKEKVFCYFDKTRTQSRGDIEREISKYETLNELEPSQVVKAFWLGYIKGNMRLAFLEEMRRSYKQNPSQPTTFSSQPEYKCPTADELLTQLNVKVP